MTLAHNLGAQVSLSLHVDLSACLLNFENSFPCMKVELMTYDIL